MSQNVADYACGGERFHLRKVQVYRSIARHIRYVDSVTQFIFRYNVREKERKKERQDSSVTLRAAFFGGL